MAFLSDEKRMILKLLEKTNICGCEETYLTNYPGLYIRDTKTCNALASKSIAPFSVNLGKWSIEK